MHCLRLLRRLVLPDGSTLRAQLPGRPMRDSLFRGPLRNAKLLLKVCVLGAHCRTWRLLLFSNPRQVTSLCGSSGVM